MRRTFIALIFSASLIQAAAQKDKYVRFSIYNTQSAYPFSKFTGLFKEVFHPGMEYGAGKIIKPKVNHEWFREYRIGFFYHRFVQVGIPVSVNFGYRYKFNNHFTLQAALGAGYMQSIPATQKFVLDDQGNYQGNKGVGRMQATASFEIGMGYILNPKKERPLSIISGYQQRLQFPFVRSYVPLLPYNNFILGLTMPLKKMSQPSNHKK